MSNIPRGYSQNQQFMAQNNQHNFNNGFRQSTNLIPPQDWSNSGNLMHNNVAPNVYNELVMDYYLHIDSYDRDVNAYPSSFKFTVSLGGSGTSSEKVYDKQTGTFRTINYTGVPEPRIQRNFYNVKYISLDKIILPKFAVYSFTEDETDPNNIIRTYTGVTSFSEKYRYLILKIKELDNNRIFSTNNRLFIVVLLRLVMLLLRLEMLLLLMLLFVLLIVILLIG